jgi:hypothetical protein
MYEHPTPLFCGRIFRLQTLLFKDTATTKTINRPAEKYLSSRCGLVIPQNPTIYGSQTSRQRLKPWRVRLTTILNNTL